MGMTPSSTGMSLLKGGLTGLSQGLANYGNPHPVYDFSQLAQGFQPKKQPIVDMSYWQKLPSKIPKQDTGDATIKPDPQVGQVGNDPDAQAARWRKLSQLTQPQNPPPIPGFQGPNPFDDPNW